MSAMPMFPLGSVLFPYMPLPLRVFEDRYLVMLSHILQSEPSEFGVVLIERGQEVGGGERRFGVGTVAQISELDASEDFVVLVAQGERRIEVSQWAQDDPYPMAEVRELPELNWTADLADLRERAEVAVRRLLSVASEFTDGGWPADVELSDDEIASCWQLAAIAPIGPLDQVTLLRSESTSQLLQSIIELSDSAEQTFHALWADGDDADGDDADGDDADGGPGDGGAGDDPDTGRDGGDVA